MANTSPGGNGERHQPFWTRAQQLEKRPPCQAQCPNSGDARAWLGIIAQRKKHGLTLEQAYDAAWARLAELNPLPATIGRICPHPCETRCTRSGKDGAVAINAMERFLGDWALERRLALPVENRPVSSRSVGVIGSGPAGLSFAYQMARRGYPVTVYERGDKPGGMLRNAIPDYRLPRSVLDREIQRIFDLRVTLVRGLEPGRDIPLDMLRKRHSLLFLGLGAQGARALGIPGEDGPGVSSGIEYLRRRKAGMSVNLGPRVVVIGGGNTAIDAARSARRQGSVVTVLYRRSRDEMPAAEHEVNDAMTEGVEFTFLAAPTQVLRDNGRVTGIEFQPMKLGEPDDQGRRRPLPSDAPLQTLRADSVLVAVSQLPDWEGMPREPGDSSWMMTREDGRLTDDLWAGGDATGPGIASRAIAQGRLAAEAAHTRLSGEPCPAVAAEVAVDSARVQSDYYPDNGRQLLPRRSAEGWLLEPNQEIDQTIDSQRACEEAARCMSCGLCFDCAQCRMYCNAGGFSPLEETGAGHYYRLDLAACEGCGKCIELCPCGYLEAREDSPWPT